MGSGLWYTVETDFPVPANTSICLFLCLLLVSRKNYLVWFTIMFTAPFSRPWNWKAFIYLLWSFMDSSTTVHFREVYSTDLFFFFRLIPFSLLAHACPITGDTISSRHIKTTATSLPSHTIRGEFRFPKPQSSLWSPGKPAILSSKQRVWPHSDTLCRTQTQTMGW